MIPEKYIHELEKLNRPFSKVEALVYLQFFRSKIPNISTLIKVFKWKKTKVYDFFLTHKLDNNSMTNGIYTDDKRNLDSFEVSENEKVIDVKKQENGIKTELKRKISASKNKKNIIENDNTFRFTSEQWHLLHPEWEFTTLIGKNIKEIIRKMERLVKLRTIEYTTVDLNNAIEFFFKNLPEWYRDKELRIIVSHFDSIIETIKNNKQQKNLSNFKTIENGTEQKPSIDEKIISAIKRNEQMRRDGLI